MCTAHFLTSGSAGSVQNWLRSKRNGPEQSISTQIIIELTAMKSSELSKRSENGRHDLNSLAFAISVMKFMHETLEKFLVMIPANA
jgi:urease accessory protein UreF